LKLSTTDVKDRSGLIQQLGSMDMLVCSYGVMQQEIDSLSRIHWKTIVLDEAQAIKNAETKRAKAIFTLKGDFKLITTGTPIENHLDELWSLFHFINPGLLGSQKQFSENYGNPIQKYQDAKAKKYLKTLIQPFILRRRKQQVLESLPAKTEILKYVDLSGEEEALYEALRIKAIENIEKTQGPPAQKHIKILSEIMKLRRVCCHPSLVFPESTLSGSKLDAFLELIEELRENNHKALVFSQFVGHLDIIKKNLDKRGIVYQYLDGSTPIKDRKTRVDAFQSGQGDLFLISLKAGGVGLNLTAADFVIHMDPWWNPAVEDQASDRAHRIGQLRPVTIYRLITRNSIEEKILKLHHDKRSLSDDLLEGSDLSGKISAKELISLITRN
ncbi:MAG: DEAD/DEAH box helicase, partial [Candidatus Margulisiibacteriota bacterium]